MTQQSLPDKPIPYPTQETSFYWEKCSERELWVRSCNSCKTSYFYPRDICPGCFSRDTVWIKCSGRANLHAFGVVARAPHRAWVEEVPFIVAMVDLEEGCRMPTNIVGVSIDPNNLKGDLEIGMPLELSWDERTDGYIVPVFRPV